MQEEEVATFGLYTLQGDAKERIDCWKERKGLVSRCCGIGGGALYTKMLGKKEERDCEQLRSKGTGSQPDPAILTSASSDTEG